jgi:hypothetical protein
MRLLLTAAACCVTALSCGDSTEPCGAPLSLSVSAGVAPTFSWSPDCAVAALVVSEDGNSSVKWHVEASANEIESGVQFGQTPPGANALVAPVPLTSGTTYVVSLGVLQEHSDLPAFVAQVLFMP